MDATVFFLIALARVTAIVMTAPVFGSRAVPLKLRIGIALLLTLTAFPLIDSSSIDVTIPGQIVTAIFSELIIGSMLGLGVYIMFSAAQVAGTVISQMAGIQISSRNMVAAGHTISSYSH